MPYFQKDDYPELPEDTPLLCEITEVEMTKSRAFGSDELRDQIAFRFEIIEGEFAGAKVRGWANAVFSPRSTLARIAMAAFTDENLEGIDTDELVGKRLYVIGDYGEDGKSTFLRPRRFKPAVKAEGNGRSRGAAPRPIEPRSEAAREPVAATPAGSPSEPTSDVDF